MKKTLVVTFCICLVCFAAFAGETNENLQYINTKEGKTSCDFGILYKEAPEGMEVEISGVATGKGADIRRWEISDIKLDAGGEFVRPVSNNVFYGDRKSLFALPAAFVFAAIGTQYEMYGNECSSGRVCNVSGHPDRSALATGIDKAGMTVGLGLLAAQAKGEIKGLKSIFKLNKEQAAIIKSGKGKIRFVLEDNNTAKKQKLSVKLSQKDPQ